MDIAMKTNTPMEAGADKPDHAHPLERAVSEQNRLWKTPQTSIGQPEAGWLSASEVFRTSPLVDMLLARQALSTPDLDLKAQAAYLTIGYCNLLSVVFVPMLVGFNVFPDLSTSTVYLMQGGGGDENEGVNDSPVSSPRVKVRLSSTRFMTVNTLYSAHEDAEYFSDEAFFLNAVRKGVEAHLVSLIEVLSAKSGLARSALWRLAADSVASVFLEAGRRFSDEISARKMALAVLKEPGSPLNNKQLHFFELQLRDQDNHDTVMMKRTFRARGGCCRFYTSSTGYFCSTCVLRDRQSRDRILIEGMRASLTSAQGS